MKNLISELIDKLHKGIVNFTYRKVNGELRPAVGTLRGVGHTIKGTGKQRVNNLILQYYDLDCQAWRSFRVENIVEVGDAHKGTPEQHHEICLALVVKLKKAMQENKDKGIAFAYRKKDGSVRYAHGTILSETPEFDENGAFFFYFDTDKNEERKFRIDAFIGFGEKEEVDEYKDFAWDLPDFGEDVRGGGFHSAPVSEDNSYSSFSGSTIKKVLADKGIDIDNVEDTIVIDLIPYLNKEQLKDLIIKATTRLAEL